MFFWSNYVDFFIHSIFILVIVVLLLNDKSKLFFMFSVGICSLVSFVCKHFVSLDC